MRWQAGVRLFTLCKEGLSLVHILNFLFSPSIPSEKDKITTRTLKGRMD